jgi:hypothetical protein
MRTGKLTSTPDDKPLTLSDVLFAGRFFLGVVVGAAAFLMAISAPGAFHAWLHRDGYRQTDIVLESVFYGRATVRVQATGEKFSTPSSSLENPEQLGPRRVWYNPAATLGSAQRLFDQRIVTRHDPHSVETGVMPLVLAVVLCVASYYLWRGLLNSSGPAPARRPRRAELRSRRREKR